MARRRSDGGRHGGGAEIQAPRPRRARLATGCVALAAGVALAAYPAAQDVDLRWVALSLGTFAVALLTLGVAARLPGALGFGLTVLGAEYAVLFAAEGESLDRYTPVYALGFLLLAELAFWSIERRVPAWSEPEVIERKLAWLTGVSVGAAAAAALVMVVAAAASGGGGVAVEALGVVAAVGSVVLLAALVRRAFSEVDSRA